MPKKPARLPWIFVDGATQETFRIRLHLPEWDLPAETDEAEQALCEFHITADDGKAFDFELQISGDVLTENEVRDAAALQLLVQGKGVEIIEGAIHNGIRGNQQLLWQSDGVSVVA